MRSEPYVAPAVAAVLVAAGCAGPTPTRYHELSAELDRHRHPVAATDVDDVAPFLDTDELSREALIRAVLARNPSLEASRQAWREATADIPGATAFDDPTLAYSFAPLSPFDDEVDYGQVITLSQRVPWPGKRGARGEEAIAEAEAEQANFLASRLELALTAATLYDEYFRISRALDINRVHIELLDQAQQSARAEFEAGRATLQDPLQAEVEASHLQHRQIALEGERDALVARLNALMHRDQDRPLPPPPAERPIPAPIDASADALIAEAMQHRVELEGVEARVRAGQAALDVARLDDYPDVGLSASYNSMWGRLSHQLMVGVSLNVPIWRAARRAEVDRARARTSRASAERDHLRTEIAADVVALHRRAAETRHVVVHYRDQIVPASRDRVDAAQAAFASGELSFFAFVSALVTLRTHELEYEEYIARLYQRLAALERAVGRIPGHPDPGALDRERIHDHDH